MDFLIDTLFVVLCEMMLQQTMHNMKYNWNEQTIHLQIAVLKSLKVYRHFLYFLSSMLSCLLRFPEKKLCSARPYLQLFVKRRMFYLRYLCFFEDLGKYKAIQLIISMQKEINLNNIYIGWFCLKIILQDYQCIYI
jgi:hypothetical protein